MAPEGPDEKGQDSIVSRREILRNTATTAALGVAASAGVSGYSPKRDSGSCDDEIERVFGAIDCEERGSIRVCRGSRETRVESFDGTPLDVNVALPAKGDGEPPYPLIVRMSGYSGTKNGPFMGGADFFEAASEYAEEGFAVLTFSQRGRAESCGTVASRLAAPEGCADGWGRLFDLAYDVRDIQYLAGLLVDECVAQPRIGAIGGSGGGGRSLSLATLRDRIRLVGGGYERWTSPRRGIPMEAGAAVPFIGWSDLAYALVPNGRVLDYAIAPLKKTREPYGAMKTSQVTALFAQGQAQHYNAPPGQDPSTDLTTWYLTGNLYEAPVPTVGETNQNAARELQRDKSALGVPIDRPPAPTLFANGFTDDIMPVNQALRWKNHVFAEFPSAPIAQFYANFGHRRSTNPGREFLATRARAWFKRHLQGREDVREAPPVEVISQRCEANVDPSDGEVYTAESWRQLQQGEMRVVADQSKRVFSDAEDPTASSRIDPVFGRAADLDSCRTVTDMVTEGTALYRLPTTDAGFTLIGSPTLHVDLSVTGDLRTENALVVGLLWDVAPDGETRTLVTRGYSRPRRDENDRDDPLVFQLFANAYEFEPGHQAELQVLGRSTPNVRAPIAPFILDINTLDLRLPTADGPSDVDEVSATSPRLLPDGYEWAPGYGDERERDCAPGQSDDRGRRDCAPGLSDD